MLRSIDAHVGGQAVRLVVEGFPAPRGRDMAEKSDWAARHSERLRRVLMFEPRGHRDLIGAVLTEPVTPGANAGLMFMNSNGYFAMSVEGIIGATLIALDRQLLDPGNRSTGESASETVGPTILYDTPAGSVRVRVNRTGPANDRAIAVAGVPSFVFHPGVSIQLPTRHLLADVVFAGRFYAVVDSETAGVGMTPDRLSELRRVGVQILSSAKTRVRHPADPRIEGLDGVVFTGPGSDGRADLRVVTVLAEGIAERSPSGTGTSAVMTVLHAMGLLAGDTVFVTESLIGTRFRGRIVGQTQVGDYDAIVPEIEAPAWITGEHTFIVDSEDPLGEGFRGEWT